MGWWVVLTLAVCAPVLMANTPDSISNTVVGVAPQGVIAAILLWLGRRMLAQNERMVEAMASAIDELRKSREAFEAKRK
jgi:energy-converting hydrogenase Eha subunit B